VPPPPPPSIPTSTTSSTFALGVIKFIIVIVIVASPLRVWRQLHERPVHHIREEESADTPSIRLVESMEEEIRLERQDYWTDERALDECTG
jgi:hypothetical protein